MNRIATVAVVSLSLFPVLASATDFPSSCFVETTQFVPEKPGYVTVVTDWQDDLFFIQNGDVLPIERKDVVRKSEIPIHIVNPPKWSVNPVSYITDASDDTFVEIPPEIRAKETVTLEFSFDSLLPRGSFRPVIRIVWGEYSVEVSQDGKAFAPTNENSLPNFDIKAVRLVFLPAPTQSAITAIRSFRFEAVAQDTLFIKAESASPITAYRTYRCDQANLAPFRSSAPSESNSVSTDRIEGGVSRQLSVPVSAEKYRPSAHPVSPRFSPNPAFGEDSDSDGIPDSMDNCPTVANRDQADRNFDGRGDACTDDDHDGLVWNADNCPTVANPDQADLNHNGIGDACEFDSDGDGIPDGIDNAIHVPNPDQKDSDHDGIGDVIDNCELSNPDQLDLDQNGRGDVCDRDTKYKATHDSDHDGILDFQDNCQKVSNPDQKDSDGDGVGDVCDNCPAIVNADQKDANKNGRGDMCEDVDADGVEGWRDNCPTVSNPDQRDSNNDGVGDACSDVDHDGIFDSLDNCPTTYNPKQEDVDGDKIGNACDPKDDRALESNRTVFMILAVVIALVFISGIGVLFFKMSKTPPNP